jgi:hypothetical protein
MLSLELAYLYASVVSSGANFTPIPSRVEIVEAAAGMGSNTLVTNETGFETRLEAVNWRKNVKLVY